MQGCPANLHIQTITASTAAPATQYSVSQSCGLSAASRWTIKWVRPWGLPLQICQKGCAILNLPSKWVLFCHLLAKKLHFIGMHPSHLHVLCFFCTNTQYGQPSLGVPGLVSFCCTVWSTWVRFTCDFGLRLCLFFIPFGVKPRVHSLSHRPNTRALQHLRFSSTPQPEVPNRGRMRSQPSLHVCRLCLTVKIDHPDSIPQMSCIVAGDAACFPNKHNL